MSAVRDVHGDRRRRSPAVSGWERQGETHATRIALEQPAGRYALMAGGAAVVVAGPVLVYPARTRRFREELKEGQMGRSERRWITVLGVAGYLARGVVFTLAGFFVARAAWQYDPKQASGLDGALARLTHGPYGLALLA